jgi:hypothetical protein
MRFRSLRIDQKNDSYTISSVQGSSDSQGLGAKTGIRCVTPLWRSKAGAAPATVSGEFLSHFKSLRHEASGRRDRGRDPQARRPASNETSTGGVSGKRVMCSGMTPLYVAFLRYQPKGFGVKACQSVEFADQRTRDRDRRRTPSLNRQLEMQRHDRVRVQRLGTLSCGQSKP